MKAALVRVLYITFAKARELTAGVCLKFWCKLWDGILTATYIGLSGLKGTIALCRMLAIEHQS
jgi:hypothetical protein